jgi:hypothetical protein
VQQARESNNRLFGDIRSADTGLMQQLVKQQKVTSEMLFRCIPQK